LGLFSGLGCGSQASPDYKGEALLTLRGSVEIEQAPESGDLEPALAFFDMETGKVHIVEVEVEGEFPSDFTLRVMAPPPDEAFFEGPAGIRSALGYITAVTEDHPKSFRYSTQTGGAGYCYGDAESTCDHVSRWCSGDEEHRECYSEIERCSGGDAPVVSGIAGGGPQTCEVIETEGDPGLKDTWAHFAGLSEDLVLVYLSEALEADAKDALRLGLPRLDAGYALLEPTPGYDADSGGGAKCDQAINKRALELYEQKYEQGITYDYLLKQGGCGGEEKTEWIPCDPRVDDVWTALDEEFGPQAAAEVGCRIPGSWQLVENPESAHVAIRIGTDVEPSVFAPDRYDDIEEFLGPQSDGQADPAFVDPCTVPKEDPIAWTDAGNPTGQSPEALFGHLEGSCTSTLEWDGDESGSGPLVEGGVRTLTPASGSTGVGVELVFDRESARYLSYPDLPEGSCTPRLEVTAMARVATDDGAFDETFTATLRTDYPHITGKVDYEDLAGTFDVQHYFGEVFWVWFAMSGEGDTCAGDVEVQFLLDESGGVRSVQSYHVGHWSNSGCEVGDDLLDVAVPSSPMTQSIADIVRDLAGERNVPATWDDGSSTTLSIAAKPAATTTCGRSDRHGGVPVDIVLSTTDGALAAHEAEGYAGVSWRDGPPRVSLTLNESLACESKDATLYYTPTDCSDVHGVTLQLDVSLDGSNRFAGNALHVYEFARGGLLDRIGAFDDVTSANPESADRRRILTLNP
jgi:hypothetical protein